MRNQVNDLSDSEASENKPKECPAGHQLKRLNIGYIPGTCDGCKTRMKPKEWVMDCRECNYYLCQWCCPQDGRDEAPDRMLTLLNNKVAQEITDLRETTTASCYVLAPLATCGAIGAKQASDATEFTVDVDAHRALDHRKAVSDTAAEPMSGGGDADGTHATQVLPEKAPEEHVSHDDEVAQAANGSVDLLGLGEEEAPAQSSKGAQKVEDADELSSNLHAIQAGA